jgi:transcriptional regulator with XRE-family HTH domain
MSDESLRASIGRTAKAARLQLRLTQRDVAESIGIHAEVYGRLERGDMAPSIGTLRRLCVALGISADEAFSLEPSGEPPAALEPAQPEDALIRRLLRRVSVLSPRSVRTLVLVAANMPSDTRKKRAR